MLAMNIISEVDNLTVEKRTLQKHKIKNKK